MKPIYVLLAAVFLLTGCPPAEQEIEDTMSKIRVINDSSHNIFIQYYCEPDSTILLRSRFNAHYVPDAGYHHTLGYTNPNDSIGKIIIVDTDSHKVLKRIEAADGFFELEKAENDYGMLARREHYLFTITDELFDEH